MTVWAADVEVAVQFAKPLPRLITGVAGRAPKAALNATVIVEPAESVPVELEVKPTVQFDRAPAVCGAPANETVVTDGSIVYGSGSRRVVELELEQPVVLRLMERPAGVGRGDGVARRCRRSAPAGTWRPTGFVAAAEVDRPIRAQVRLEG